MYKALGLAIPTFAHLPMILGSDKKRLSKRHAATNVQEYREKGFTPRSIINYLSLLGWNPDSDQEIFDVKELINAFNFSQVQKKPATFDEKKLLWVSGQQMAKTETSVIIKEIEILDNNWGINQDSQYKKAVISLVKDRSKTNQALITALGFGLTWAQDSPAPWLISTMIIPVLKKRKINNSNDPIEVKNERKKRLRRNAQLGSIPFYKWIVIILRSPKAILDNISS